MGFVKHKATTKAKITMENFEVTVYWKSRMN